MERNASRLEGLWLPLVTPFRDGRLDEASLRRLVEHYAGQPLDGWILAATTGEGLTLDDDETERLCHVVAAGTPDGRPIYLGLSGSDTRRVLHALDRTAGWPIQAISSSAPITRGRLKRACIGISRCSRRQPHGRSSSTTSRISRERDSAAARRTAKHRRCEGLLRRPGAILRSPARTPAGLCRAHRRGCVVLWCADTGSGRRDPGGRARGSAGVRRRAQSPARRRSARRTRGLEEPCRAASVVFAEPSPAPIKHWLWHSGLIDSPEVRLPMTGVSEGLARRLAQEAARRALSPAA
jgi:4-hydroxy-tetrahydrodipicolinate synthase